MRLVWMFDQKNMTHTLVVNFSNPATLSLRIKVRQKLSDDTRYKRFECLVPSILFGIDDSFSMDYPAHVTDAVRA